MKKKQFISWFTLLISVFLLFFAGGSQVKADTAADVDSAINYGTNIIRQNESIDAWGGVCLSVSDGGITDAQAQNAYDTIVTTNPLISGKNVTETSNYAATIGLAALGKNPTHVVGDKDVVAPIRDESTKTTDLNTMINDLWSLSTGNYGPESQDARVTLTEKIIQAQQKNGLWNEYGSVYVTGNALMVLSMNSDQPGVSASIQKAISGVSENLYLEDGGFRSDSPYENDNSNDNAIMTGGLAAAGVDVYKPLDKSSKTTTTYTSPVQRLLDQKVETTDPRTIPFEQDIYNLEQARFTHDGGKGSIFAFDQNPTFRPRELAKLNSAAAAKKVAINDDSTATVSDKATAINTVDQLLQAYITKINADTVSTDAIVDRATGVANINNVALAHTATPTTPTTPTTPSVTNNYTTIVNNPTNSSSSSTNPSTTSSSSAPVATTTPTVTKKPVKKVKQSVVYALTTVKLYKNTNFTKSNLTKTYKKRARINRPMFLVISQRTNKQGHAIYRVKDMNSGKTGYTLSGSKYFANAYYSAKVTHIKVINPKGINEYGKIGLTNKKRHVKKNASLNVKKVVDYGTPTRLQLTNGHYITGNKKLVLATKIQKASFQGADQNATATTGATTVAKPTNPGTTTTTTTSKPTSTTGTTTTTNGSPTTNPVTPESPTVPVTPVNPSNDTSTITTTITIQADGSTIASGSIKVKKGATAFDALQAFAQQQGLTLTYKGSGATAYVTGINGHNAGPAGTMTGWLYYVNGAEPSSSMGAYALKDGDAVSIVYNP